MSDIFDFREQEEELKERRRLYQESYFLCEAHRRRWIQKGPAKMLYEGGECNSIQSGGETEEILRQKLGIPAEPCRECGQIFCTTFSEPMKSEMLAANICSNCHFWREYVEKRDDPHIARIKGLHYWANPPTGQKDTRFNGFAGQNFHIRFHDGREIETNDLWHQGDIPLIFRNRLPDNADFVDRQPNVKNYTLP